MFVIVITFILICWFLEPIDNV